MAGLAHEDFADKAGTAYRVAPAGIDPLTLTLRTCEPLADSGREGGSFRLEFTGPQTPYLPQSIYSFAAPGEAPVDIFIVPIAAEADALVYEAVFF